MSEVEAETTTEAPKKEVPVVQENVTEECTEVTEEVVITKPKGTVECIDEGDQSLAEYKQQIGGQPNPFENDTPTKIDDRPVEDYVGEGEDRPAKQNTSKMQKWASLIMYDAHFANSMQLFVRVIMI